MASTRQLSNDHFSHQDEDGMTHLIALDERAVYGLQLAMPESDEETYRVALVRTAREVDTGAEREQRLTLAELPSHMQAEAHLLEVSDALHQEGLASLAEHRPVLQAQPAEYTAGFMVVEYPPDAIFTGEPACVSILGIDEQGVQQAVIDQNLPPHEATRLAMRLEDVQAAGGDAALLNAALNEAHTRGQLEVGQALFPPAPHSPIRYLDHRATLEREARSETAWVGQDRQLGVLPTSENYQVVWFDVYQDSQSGDLGGRYVSLSEYGTEADANLARDNLLESLLHDEPIQIPPSSDWQAMLPEHYAVYEHLIRRDHPPDLSPDDPLIAEAQRLGAQITELTKEPIMHHTLQAERFDWQVAFNEDVTHIPPYITAEYLQPADQTGITPVRLRPKGDDSLYAFEVSTPDDEGQVDLFATKTFDSPVLLKPVTEYALLKSYPAEDVDTADTYANPRGRAMTDARALVFEWGRHDLDHAMGSALQLAHENGFEHKTLFQEGPFDTFAPVKDARSIEEIRGEQIGERQLSLFGRFGYDIPEPNGLIYEQAVGQYGVDPEVDPGVYYGVTVREAYAVQNPEEHETPLFVVEGVKAWLPEDTQTTEVERVTLDIRDSSQAGAALADDIARLPDVVTRLDRMAQLAHTTAQDNQHLKLATHDEIPPAEVLQLHLRETGLFIDGPPDPEHPDFGEAIADINEFSTIQQRPDQPKDLLPDVPHPSTDDTPPVDPRWDDPDESVLYKRVLEDTAYDLPLENGQAYEFRMRSLPYLEPPMDPFDEEPLAIEVVKHWQDRDQPQSEMVTLSLFQDMNHAREEVDTYADLAEREGVQAAMSRAAALADVEHEIDVEDKADQWGIVIHPDVRFGQMFSQGPEDPFLSEREINHISLQYAETLPSQHQVSLEVVPVHDAAGKTLGHSVIALDAAFEVDEPAHELEDALSVTAHELAQFESKAGADFYMLALSEYMGKNELAPQGEQAHETLDFVKSVQQVNGLADHQQTLTPTEVTQLQQGGWALEHEGDAFKPMTVEDMTLVPPTGFTTHELDF